MRLESNLPEVKFSGPLIAELIREDTWRIYKKFEFSYKYDDIERTITIDKGFVTDFATVPRIFWWLVSPIGNHAAAAAVHDYCYKSTFCSRVMCDKMFLAGMRELGTKKWKRCLMYVAVRLFGWRKWEI